MECSAPMCRIGRCSVTTWPAPGATASADSSPPALRWKFETHGEIWSSPAIGIDGTVYVGSLDHRVYAIGEDGNFRWAYETFGPIWSSPAVAGDGTVYVASVDRNLYALARGTREVVHQARQLRVFVAFARARRHGLSRLEQWQLHAIGYDGKFRFSATTRGGVSSSPALAANGDVFVGSDYYTLVPGEARRPHRAEFSHRRSGALVAGHWSGRHGVRGLG